PSPDSARWISGAQLISDRPTAAICWSMVRRQRRDNMENRIPKRSRGEDEGMDNDLNSIEWNQIIPLMPGTDQRGTASSPPGTGTETGPDHHERHAQQCHQAYPQGHGGQRLFAEVGYDAQTCIDRPQQCRCQQGELALNEAGGGGLGSGPGGYIRVADTGPPQAGESPDGQRGHAPLLIGRFERGQFTDRAPPQNAGQQPQSQYQVAAGPYGGGEDVNQQQVGIHGSVRAGVGTGRSGSSLLSAALRREVILR